MAAQVPDYMRTPFITSGYRLGGTYQEALFSLFRWHNETLNSWTLLIIPVVSLTLFLHSLRSGMITTKEQALITFFMPLHTLVHAPLSVQNHLHTCRDKLTHFFWRNADVAGTHFASILLHIPLSYFVFSRPVFYFLLFCQSCVGLILMRQEYNEYMSIKRGHTIHWNRVVKVLLVTLEVVLYLIPVLYKRSFHAFWIPLSLILGGLTYALHIPERFFPGRLNFVFQGNTIMHFSLLVAHLLEFSFVLQNMNSFQT